MARIFILMLLLLGLGAELCAQKADTSRRSRFRWEPVLGDSVRRRKPDSLQTRWQLRHVYSTGLPGTAWKKRIHRQMKAARDSAQAVKLAQLAATELQLKGFAAASIDSLSRVRDSLLLGFYTGPYHFYDSLGLMDAAGRWMQLSVNSRLTYRPFSWADLQLRLSNALRRYENSGYPFAAWVPHSLHYRQLSPDTLGVGLAYRLEPGPFITVDSLIPIGGKIRERERFLRSITGIRFKEAYRQNEVDAIPRLLNNTPYYQNVQPPRVEFGEKKAKIYIPMERKKSNKFDALLGLLPPREGESKFDFTALIDLLLVSPLKQGEILSLNYQKLTTSSQQLKVGLMLPYLFGMPLKLEFRFELLKLDTLFLTRIIEPGLYYPISRQLELRLYYRNQVSNITDTRPFRSTVWPPPPVLDAANNLAGIQLRWNSIDYLPNPQKGISLTLDVALGLKQITKTAGLDSLDYTRLNLNQPRQELCLDVAWYRRTFRRQVLLLRNRTFWLGLDTYFDNDMAMLGGGRNLRGFNENQFYASLYSLFTLEYRFLIEKNSYFGLFVDYAYMEYRNTGTRTVQHPVGVGFSLALKTPLGILSLAYAVGQVGSQSFQPLRGRIHVGVVANF